MTERVLIVPKGTVYDVLVTTKAATVTADDQEVLEEATTYFNELTTVLNGRQVTRAAAVLAAWSLLVNVVKWALGENENPVQ